MPDSTELDEYYKTLTDQELLNLKREGGFSPEAEQVFGKELGRRNLGPDDLKQFVASTRRKQLQEEVTERGGGYRMPGLQFFGRRYLNEADKRSDIQVKTKWFTMSGIPLIPIASYRFKCGGSGTSRHANEHSAINRVPMDWIQVFQTWTTTAIVFIGILLLSIGIFSYLDHGKH